MRDSINLFQLHPASARLLALSFVTSSAARRGRGWTGLSAFFRASINSCLSNSRVAPFLVCARSLSRTPSYSNPRNFRGFSHLPSDLMAAVLSGWISRPHDAQLTALCMKFSIEASFPYTRPSSAYIRAGKSVNMVGCNAKDASRGEVGLPCGTPRFLIRSGCRSPHPLHSRSGSSNRSCPIGGSVTLDLCISSKRCAQASGIL